MYLYVLACIFLALTFVCFRINGKASPNVPWYDWILAGAVVASAGFFAWTANVSLDSGWEYAAPDNAVWFSILLYALILEGTRRAGGLVLFGIVLVFSLYPTFAEHVPDPLNGFTQPFRDVVPFFMISSEASFGIPMRAFGNLVIGFILSGWAAPDRPAFTLGYIHVPAFAILVPMTVLCAPYGVKLAHSMNPRPLKLLFAFFLFITALNMLRRGIYG